jgi:hypothetical protein
LILQANFGATDQRTIRLNNNGGRQTAQTNRSGPNAGIDKAFLVRKVRPSWLGVKL